MWVKRVVCSVGVRGMLKEARVLIQTSSVCKTKTPPCLLAKRQHV